MVRTLTKLSLLYYRTESAPKFYARAHAFLGAGLRELRLWQTMEGSQGWAGTLPKGRSHWNWVKGREGRSVNCFFAESADMKNVTKVVQTKNVMKTDSLHLMKFESFEAFLRNVV